jgi:hypothetical protein
MMWPVFWPFTYSQAQKKQLAGEFDGQLKMRLQAQPVEGVVV